MAKVFIEETTLTAIGDAIRGKEGTTELVPVNDMATRISDLPEGGGDIEVEPIVLTGNCNYACKGQIGTNYINLFGNTVSTKDISDLNHIFEYSLLEEIPFQINTQDVSSLACAFQYMENLKVCPKIRGTIKWNTSAKLSNMLYATYDLRDVEDLFTADMLEGFSGVKITSAYLCPQPLNFSQMYSLRTIPSWWYKFRFNEENTIFPAATYTLYPSAFSNCRALDEALNIPVWKCQAAQTSNMFSSIFSNCCRIKNITFETNEDGTPVIANWKAQTIDLTSYVGYVQYQGLVIGYNSGITADKEVKDDRTYQALKDDPDWFTCFPAYCRYNHDSAVATINSLPDTSAYLATAGGTNTIKFKGESGSATDGGAINTLTEEEIAVAAAKGWTVTLI